MRYNNLGLIHGDQGLYSHSAVELLLERVKHTTV